MLDIHCEETHSTFFKAKLEKHPSDAHFRCYAKGCINRYASAAERNEHCKLAHSIDDPRAKLAGRKAAKDSNIEEEIRKLSLNESHGLRQCTSGKIRFGDGQERVFEEKRKVAVPKRKNK